MTTETDSFGAGIFDDQKETESPKDEVTPNSEVTLTDRERAIAMGEDPDAPEEQIEDEQADDLDEPVGESQPDEVQVSEEEEPVVSSFSLGDKRLAARYGLSEDDVEKFGTPEALHHALDLMDKAGSDKSQKDSTESPAEVASEDAAVEDEGRTLSESVLGFEKLDISKYENADEPYDKDTIELVKHVRKTEDMLERLVQSISQSQSSKTSQVFHDMLDKYPEVYGNTLSEGKPVKIKDSYEKARAEVRDQAETIYAGIVARKGVVPPMEKIIEQAIMAVHGNAIKLNSVGTSAKSEKLKSQSSKRRSVGSAATTRKRIEAESDPADPKMIAKHPEIEALWRKAQEENGAV